MWRATLTSGLTKRPSRDRGSEGGLTPLLPSSGLEVAERSVDVLQPILDAYQALNQRVEVDLVQLFDRVDEHVQGRQAVSLKVSFCHQRSRRPDRNLLIG